MVDQPRRLDNLFELAQFQDQLAWQPFREGVEIYPLSQNQATQARAALLRYQPGATVPFHGHPGYEHIVVLAGSQQDERGEYPAGTLAINPPGSEHSVASPEGCIVFIVWEKPVILKEEPQPNLGQPG